MSDTIPTKVPRRGKNGKYHTTTVHKNAEFSVPADHPKLSEIRQLLGGKHETTAKIPVGALCLDDKLAEWGENDNLADDVWLLEKHLRTLDEHAAILDEDDYRMFSLIQRDTAKYDTLFNTDEVDEWDDNVKEDYRHEMEVMLNEANGLFSKYVV